MKNWRWLCLLCRFSCDGYPLSCQQHNSAFIYVNVYCILPLLCRSEKTDRKQEWEREEKQQRSPVWMKLEILQLCFKPPGLTAQFLCLFYTSSLSFMFPVVLPVLQTLNASLPVQDLCQERPTRHWVLRKANIKSFLRGLQVNLYVTCSFFVLCLALKA